MKKYFFVLVAAFFFTLTTSCSTKQPQQSTKNQLLIPGVESSLSNTGDIKNIKIIVETSNVRSGCSNNAPVVYTAAKNNILDVVGQVPNWFAVRIPSSEIGFIPKQEAAPVVVDSKIPNAQASTEVLTVQEQEMLNLINQARAENNAPPLQIDMHVTNVARTKAQDMIDNNYFSHYSPKYGSPFDMLKSFGISYVQAGENIAGNQNVQDAHSALMNSPGHRKNILNPNYTHIGLGIKSGGHYGNMFSQMFVSKPK